MKINKITFLIILIAIPSILLFGRTIDTVYSFKAGSGQDFGQSSEYFPNNIFGLPSRNASYSVPEAAPEQLLSLGFDGEIIVGIKNFKIVNGEGADFTIFENCFFNPVTQKLFAEPAKVSVSKDGINFVEFPYNEQTLEGLAGKTPVYGSEDPYNPNLSGGDSFDLSALGLDYITHIKITDIARIIEKLPEESIYFQPAFILSGFDLDAIVALNTEPISLNVIDANKNSEFKINCFANSIQITNNSNHEFEYQLVDYFGRIIEEKKYFNSKFTQINNLSNGLYILRIIHNNSNINSKIIICN